MSSKANRSQKLNSLKINLKSVLLVNNLTSSLRRQLEVNQGSTLLGSEDTSSSGSSPCSLGSQLTYPRTRSVKTDTFFDHYSLGKKIGEGCNGCVYMCTYKKNGRAYAVKKTLEEEEVLSLKKSFLHMRSLAHENIVAYKALHFDEGMKAAYLVMDFLEGFRPLSDFPLQSEESLKRLAKQMVSALKYLHSHNICHRDIKPDNVMVHAETGHLKLIDFGISKKTYQRGARREMLTVIGTPYYLAPEALLGGGYDERVDLWALGITLYKLVAGRTPFESEYRSDTVRQIIEGHLTFDGQEWNSYSPFLKDFIGRLLRKANARMGLGEASKHLWLTEEKVSKFRRLSS